MSDNGSISPKSDCSSTKEQQFTHIARENRATPGQMTEVEEITARQNNHQAASMPKVPLSPALQHVEHLICKTSSVFPVASTAHPGRVLLEDIEKDQSSNKRRKSNTWQIEFDSDIVFQANPTLHSVTEVRQVVDEEHDSEDGEDASPTVAAITTASMYADEDKNDEKYDATQSLVILNISDFSNKIYLAQGAFGKVFEATYTPDGQQVAIKVINATKKNENDWKREAHMLRLVKHLHIVSFRGVCDNSAESEIWIVTEFLNGGSLRAYCTEDKRSKLDVIQKLKVCSHIWSALAYLHDEAKITHKDMKPENIMIHQTLENSIIAKICDFGLAKIKTTLSITEQTEGGGSVMYMPPETADSKRNHRKADVYATGATLCELFTGKYFWHHPGGIAFNRNQILYKLMKINDQIKESPSTAAEEAPGTEALAKCIQCPVPIRNILMKAVSFTRHQRPRASEILATFKDAIQCGRLQFETLHAESDFKFSTAPFRQRSRLNCFMLLRRTERWLICFKRWTRPDGFTWLSTF